MILVKNKKARHDYVILDKTQAGIVLTGAEVKSLRNKSGSLKGSYIKAINDELYLINAQISPYKYASNQDYDPKRSRKLLLRKKNIYKLMEEDKKKGISIIALSLELRGNKIKLNIATARGKKNYEKRELLKRKAIKRDVQRQFKEKIRIS